VLGNPPWDMIRADAGSADVRERSRATIAPVLRFAHDSGVYTAQSSGQANRYQLFTERALALTRRGGRVGLVLPAGLATDHGSAALRRRLFSSCDVDALVAIDNQRGIFPIQTATQTGLSATLNNVYVFGLPKDYPETFRAKVAAVTPEQVKSAASTLLGSETSLIAIVGDYAKVKDQLAGYKNITFLDTDGKTIAPPQ